MLRTVRACLPTVYMCKSVRNYAKRLPGVEDEKDVLQMMKSELFDCRLENYLPCPRQADIVVIGGGIVGSSVAYHTNAFVNKIDILVVEPDPMYSKASSLLSASGMRQQFSTKENIELSQYGFDFLRKSQKLLDCGSAEIPIVPPDVQFNHAGYLILADESQAPDMEANNRLQQDCGAINELLTPEKLKQKFPWINTDGIAVASKGLQGEGWFDPAALLAGLKGKARELGTTYVTGKVVGFEYKLLNDENPKSRKIIRFCLVELENGDIQPVEANTFVNCAGPWAAEVARMAGIGTDEFGTNCVLPLPVEPRKRFVYHFHAPDGPGLDCPLVTDQSQGGIYWRREGLSNHYIAGKSPTPGKEPDHSNLDEIDYDFFEHEIWPEIAHRVPAFENLKLNSAWAGYYDYNFIDHNLIIGRHPYFQNFIFANGSTGHGLQHSMGIGMAVSELIIEDEYKTIDLSRFSFERFLEENGQDLEKETNIY